MSLFSGPSRRLAAERLEGDAPRIYDPRERLLLGGFDQLLRVASWPLGLRPPAEPSTGAPRSILAARLDRIGDLLTTLPALVSLREAAPDARITLAVGSWNEAVARRLPFVDDVCLVEAPWSAWGRKTTFADARRALARHRPDLVLDFQGDVRSLALLSTTRAPMRAGYAETGGGYLLTHRATWDERRSWYWQNDELVRSVFPEASSGGPPYNFVGAEDRERASTHLEPLARPRIGIHPSAGRRLKQWELPKFQALVRKVAGRGSVVVTGTEGDRALVEALVENTGGAARALIGLDLATFAAVVEGLDVFVTGDTGPMHLSHAVGTRNVAIFGPSDPVRYGPPEGLAERIVVRQPVYCSPCNMIRRPPRECASLEAPECISGIGVDAVASAVAAALS